MAALSITAANVISSVPARSKKGTLAAGVTVTAGQVLAVDVDGNLVLCDSNSATALTTAPVGVALNGGSPGQQITYIVADPSFAIGATVVVGMPYFTSGTAGAIVPMADPTTGEKPSLIGYGSTTSRIALNIVANAVALAADPTP